MHSLGLKSIVGAPVVQVVAHTTHNKSKDLQLSQRLLETRRLIGTEDRKQIKHTHIQFMSSSTPLFNEILSTLNKNGKTAA